MSPRIDGPRRLHEDEFREAMALVADCFDRTPGELEARLPHCFDLSRPTRHAIIKVDGAVVSHVVRVPADLRVGGANVACGGIAGVATHPDHRGQGYMTRLLEFWLEELAADGVPLAELDGDRVRYGTYGWENAGRELRVRITRRSFDSGDAQSAGDGGTVRPYTGTDAGLDRIKRIHDRERYRVGRDRTRYRMLLDQRGLETHIYDGTASAYLAHRRADPTTVLEFGGSRVGIAALLGRLLDEDEEVVVFTHPRHALVPFFLDRAHTWQTIPHRKLNVLDLQGVLDAYEPLLSKRWRTTASALGAEAGTVTLGVTDDGLPPTGADAEAVRLAYDAEGVDVSAVDDEPDTTLDRRAMTRLLFGGPDGNRAREQISPFLTTVLPLEFYFWRTETI